MFVITLLVPMTAGRLVMVIQDDDERAVADWS